MSAGEEGVAVAGSRTAASLSECECEAMRVGDGVRGVLFDLDGTLLDTERLLLASFRYTMRAVLNEIIPDERLMAKVGQPLNTQMWDFTNDAAVHEELCRTYREYNAQVHDDLIRIFPGTVDALVELRRMGYPLGVVTSKRRAPALQGLAAFGLQDSFDCLIGSDDWASHKPDPGPVLHGCDLLGLRSSECVYVGDSPFDMLAGNGAGCKTVAALWGMFPESVLRAESPDCICASIEELPGLLRAG